MPHSYGESDWLLQFDRPLPGEMAQLRNILAVATVASTRTESRLRGELGHAVAVEGSLDQVLAQLGDRLIEDDAEAPAGQGCDYVVADRFPENAAIDVHTRRLDPNGAANDSVIRGRSILRIDDDRYIVWLDA